MWDVKVHPEVRPLIDALKGNKSGYSDAYKQLVSNPCAELPTKDGKSRPFAYRLSGPLQERVCGLHLKRGYRLAFTMHDPETEEHEGIVEVLYAGTRDTRKRAKDAWTIVHHICDEENPPSGHLKPPCCQSGRPDMDEDKLGEVMDRLRRLRLGR